MLGLKNGASLAEVIPAAGLQPHSARAMISMLRKVRHAMTRTKAGSESRYQIGEKA